MAWFSKRDEYTTLRPKRAQKKVDIPEGMWTRCENENCQAIIYNKDLEQNIKVCPKCNYHFKLTLEERLAQMVDEGSFQETEISLKSIDPLKFPGYKGKLDANSEKSMKEVLCGIGKMNGKSVSLGIMNFKFIGGSMGSVVGEKITRTIEQGVDSRIPVVIVSQSGGARMQEGILSLMQLSKTSAALAELHKARIPYISVLTDPTTAGIMASYASLGDVIIAEPKAYIGFAGKRVIENTIRQKLPVGFQTSEFMLMHGLLDMVVDRKDLKDTISRVLELLPIRADKLAVA